MTVRPAATALALIALASVPQAATAGAWPQAPDQWQVIQQLTLYQAITQGFDNKGRPVSAGRYTQFEYSPYIEYGLSDRWTLGAQPRVQTVWNGTSGNTRRTDGLAQANLFARYTAWRGTNDVVSIQAQYGQRGAATSKSPQVAYSSTEYELRLLYGHGFDFGGGWTGFTDIEVAGRARSGTSADELRIDVTAGVRPRFDLLFLLQSFSTIGLKDQSPGGSNYDITKLQLSAVYSLTPAVAIQIGGYTELAGRNVSLGNAGLVALWLSF